jgi:hypothetical protein
VPGWQPDADHDADVVDGRVPRLDASETALAAAREVHRQAKAARDDWQARVEDLECEYAALKRRAENPGSAPNNDAGLLGLDVIFAIARAVKPAPAGQSPDCARQTP